uniref:G_PROTEIN_RECEP_F1_2 domain-containing protein n=1 Tax=Caenorhabditis tropicalis TaxID=1561998 RepID=A0A1I7TXL3_9PELO
MGAFAVIALLIIPQFCAFVIITDRLLSKQIKMSISKNTIKMQMKFQRALYLQVFIPIIILLFPGSYLTYSVVSNYHNQAFNNILIIIVSSHGFLSTLSMIFVHTPYRNFTMSLLKIGTRFRNNNVLSVQNINSPANSRLKPVS